jgi:acyl-coenzyme A thioesterase PaaI-like protein
MDDETRQDDPLHRAPPVAAEPGWTPVEPLRIEGGRGSFVSGDPQGDTLRVAYFQRRGDGHMVGRAWFGAGTQGPPGHAHGGSTAAVLDEAMGAAAWQAGHAVVAVNLNVDLQAMLPLGTDARFDAWVERVEGRKVYCRARLFGAGDPAGEKGDYASAQGLFLTLDEARFHALLDRVARAMGTTPDGLREAMRARGWKG